MKNNFIRALTGVRISVQPFKAVPKRKPTQAGTIKNLKTPYIKNLFGN